MNSTTLFRLLQEPCYLLVYHLAKLCDSIVRVHDARVDQLVRAVLGAHERHNLDGTRNPGSLALGIMPTLAMETFMMSVVVLRNFSRATSAMLPS
jgi:hypothetical protein